MNNNRLIAATEAYLVRLGLFALVGLSIFALTPAAWGQTLVPPTIVTATTYSKSQIDVTWNDPNPAVSGVQEGGYIVEQLKGTSTTWSKAYTSKPDVTTWSNTGLTTGTSYSYRVRAFVVVGGKTVYSAYSPIATGMTQTSAYPNPPTNLAVSAVTTTSVSLKWQDHATNETGYEVERAPTTVGPWTSATYMNPNSTAYVDAGLVPHTTYAYRVTAVNAAGDSAPSNVVTATTSPDTVPPKISITSPASGTTYTVPQTVTITASASDSVGVTSVDFKDGNTILATVTTPPYTYVWNVDGNENGSHVWTAIAHDTVWSTVSAAVTLNVNIPVGNSPPVAGTVTPSAQSGSFVPGLFDLTTAFTSSDPLSSCDYTIDGSSWAPAALSGAVPNFVCSKTAIAGTNGQVLTLNMRATDGTTGTGTAITRTVDTAAPTTTSNAPAGWVATDQTVTLAASDGTGSGVGSTKYCTDTINTCTPVTVGTTVPVTCASGSCQTYVRFASTDNLNNAEVVQSALVRIDKAAPTVVISSPASGATLSTASAAVGGTASDTGAGLSSVSWTNTTTGATGPASGTSPWSATVPLQAGSNVISVTARDGVNLAGSASVTVTYTPVASPTAGAVTPSAQFGSFVGGSFNLSTGFTSSDTVTSCEYTIDGSTWAAATVSGAAPNYICSKTAITGTNGQVLTLNMRATNSAGTGTGTAITRTVDTAAPTTTGNAPAGWVATDQTVTLTASDGSGAGVGSTKYCTDTANTCTPTTVGTSVSVTCASGSCQTYVRFASTDNLNNAESVQSALVRIDKAAPTVVITSPASGAALSTASASVGGTAADTGAGVNSVSWTNTTTGATGPASGTSPWSATVPLQAGSNVISVTARDGVNLAGSASVTVTYTPVASPTAAGAVTPSAQSGNYVSGSFSLSTAFTSSDTVTGCEYTIDGSSWAPATVSGAAPNYTCSKTAITGTNGQVLALNMRATNSAGTGTATAIARTVDTAAPTTTSNAPAGWVATDQTVTLTASDGTGSGVGSTKYCTDTINTCAPATVGTSVSVTCASGSCPTYVRFASTDNLNNAEAVRSALVQIDKAAPTNGSLTVAPSSTQVALSWTGFGDTGSGLNAGSYKLVYSTTGSPAVACADGTVLSNGAATSYTHTGLTNGSAYYYRVCVADNAGNVASGATASATPQAAASDTTAPVGSLTINGGAAYTGSKIVTLNLTATDAVGVTGYFASLFTTVPLSTDSGWVVVTPMQSLAANVSFDLVFLSNTLKNVYVWYKDAAGNVSGRAQSSITLDTTVPVDGVLAATAGIEKVVLTWSGFSDAGSGVATTNPFKLVYATGTPPATCASGTTLYTGNATTFTHNTQATGVLNYYRVCATDAVGNVSAGATASAVPLANTPPVADPGPDQVGVAGTTIYFDGSASYDSDGSVVSYTYVFGDGSASVTTATPGAVGHVYASPGSYQMTLTVTDDRGATGSDIALVDVRASLPAVGNVVSGKAFGGVNSDLASATAVDSLGNTIVVGTFAGTVVFGGVSLDSSAGSTDIFILKYDSSGTLLWAKRVGGALDDKVSAVAVDLFGNVIISGSFQGTADFGNGKVLNSVGGYDAFVAKYSSNGDNMWANGIGDLGDDAGMGVAVDSHGDVLLAGSFKGGVVFGQGGSAQSYNGNSDAFVVKYSGVDGSLIWDRTLGGAGSDVARAVAIDLDKNVVVVGSFQSVLYKSATGLTADILATSAGASDVFVAKYSLTGNLLWAQRLGGPSDDAANGVAIDRGGNIVITGNFLGTVNFGGVNRTSAGGWDGFVTKFSPMGNQLWTRTFGGLGTDAGNAVATDAVGNVVMTGSFQQTADFGVGTLLTSAGQRDMVVAKYAGDGTPLWVKAFGGTADDIGYGVVIDNGGNAVLAGSFQGSVNFGGVALQSAGLTDGVLLKMAP